MKTIFWVVGDPSADIHCSHVIREISQMSTTVRNIGLGGSHMAKSGFHLLYNLCDEAIMGFIEVLKHLHTMHRLLDKTVEWVKEHKPDVIVLVDYPGFNLRLAQKLSSLQVPILYYISPQVWAWKSNRIYVIAKYIKKMLVIFPFEVEIYQKIGVNCVYVGHPLLDRIPESRQRLDYSNPPYRIALLPGSRKQEIRKIFPVMWSTAQLFKKNYADAQFFVPTLNASCSDEVRSMVQSNDIHIIENGMDTVLKECHAGIVASGTATLESALYGMPFILAYKTNFLTYLLAKCLIHVSYIGIVNIIMNKSIIPEFIQTEATPQNLLVALWELISNSTLRERMLYDFIELRTKLGSPGAIKRTAEEILREIV